MSADKVRVRVIGPFQVAGVDPGGTVELDETVNIAALVEAGHIEVLPESATKVRRPAAGEDQRAG